MLTAVMCTSTSKDFFKSMHFAVYTVKQFQVKKDQLYSNSIAGGLGAYNEWVEAGVNRGWHIEKPKFIMLDGASFTVQKKQCLHCLPTSAQFWSSWQLLINSSQQYLPQFAQLHPTKGISWSLQS